MFLCNSLERLGSALDPIGQTLVAFYRLRANDLIYATGGIVSELRLIVDVLASRIFVAHVRPFEWAPVCATEADQQKRPARWPGVSLTRFEPRLGIFAGGSSLLATLRYDIIGEALNYPPHK